MAALLFGAALMAFSFAASLWLCRSCCLLVGAGFGMMVQMAASNTILQTHRRRRQARPGDELLHDGVHGHGAVRRACWRARWRTASARRWTIAVGGACACCGGGLVSATQLPSLREHMRPIYQKLGILPEVAEGLEAAQVSTPVA